MFTDLVKLFKTDTDITQVIPNSVVNFSNYGSDSIKIWKKTVFHLEPQPAAVDKKCFGSTNGQNPGSDNADN